jgi:hypothetical protein
MRMAAPRTDLDFDPALAWARSPPSRSTPGHAAPVLTLMSDRAMMGPATDVASV